MRRVGGSAGSVKRRANQKWLPRRFAAGAKYSVETTAGEPTIKAEISPTQDGRQLICVARLVPASNANTSPSVAARQRACHHPTHATNPWPTTPASDLALAPLCELAVPPPEACCARTVDHSLGRRGVERHAAAPCQMQPVRRSWGNAASSVVGWRVGWRDAVPSRPRSQRCPNVLRKKSVWKVHPALFVAGRSRVLSTSLRREEWHR